MPVTTRGVQDCDGEFVGYPENEIFKKNPFFKNFYCTTLLRSELLRGGQFESGRERLALCGHLIIDGTRPYT
jgi:hypothetical protein